MKKKIQLFFTVVIMLSLVLSTSLITSCEKEEEVKKPEQTAENNQQQNQEPNIEYPINIDFIEISKGDIASYNGEEIESCDLVINTQEEFQNLLNRMNFSYEIETVDFDNFTVIALIGAVYNSTNQIVINRVLENNENIVVYKKLLPGLGMAITQSYYLAKLPKTNKQIVFEMEN